MIDQDYNRGYRSILDGNPLKAIGSFFVTITLPYVLLVNIFSSAAVIEQHLQNKSFKEIENRFIEMRSTKDLGSIVYYVSIPGRTFGHGMGYIGKGLEYTTQSAKIGIENLVNSFK